MKKLIKCDLNLYFNLSVILALETDRSLVLLISIKASMSFNLYALS